MGRSVGCHGQIPSLVVDRLRQTLGKGPYKHCEESSPCPYGPKDPVDFQNHCIRDCRADGDDQGLTPDQSSVYSRPEPAGLPRVLRRMPG